MCGIQREADLFYLIIILMEASLRVTALAVHKLVIVNIKLLVRFSLEKIEYIIITFCRSGNEAKRNASRMWRKVKNGTALMETKSVVSLYALKSTLSGLKKKCRRRLNNNCILILSIVVK